MYEYAEFYHKNLSNYHNNINLYNYKAIKLYEKYFGDTYSYLEVYYGLFVLAKQ